MSMYYMRTPVRSMARRHMLDHMINAKPDGEQIRVFFPVDVRVDDNEYILSAFLPGVDVEDLDIQVVNESITIQGELKIDREEGERYLINERPSGKFYRVVELPDDLDSENAVAEKWCPYLTGP